MAGSGATPHPSIEELIKAVDAVLISLWGDEAARDVTLDRVIPVARVQQLIIEMSTLSPAMYVLGARFGFIVVAPNASMNKHWNDGRGTTGEGKPSTADDVAYLKALIAEVVARYNGDPDAIFMVGASNGGIMTIRFACEAGYLLRAGSNVISNMPTKQMSACKIGKPLPWLSINGDHDTRMRFNGYSAGTMVLGHPQAGLESANRTFEFFADNAECSAAVRTEAVPDVDPADGSSAEKRVRSGCAGGTTSTQYVLRNAGHGWAGLAYGSQSARMRGGVNEDIDSGSVIWAHFQQTLSHWPHRARG